MDFLSISGKRFLITGLANKKSIAYFVGKTLLDQGAIPVFSVQNEAIADSVRPLFPNSDFFITDVSDESSILRLSQHVGPLDGLLHSIAYANLKDGLRPFHETTLSDFSQAMSISCFSLSLLAQHLRPVLASDASVVTISISDTRITAYGYMGPIKAMLDSTVAYLAKSFSAFSKIRFNAVCAGPLKTSASAGIPGYLDNYLYAEQLTLRREALQTQEVANTVCFLLSPRSSGINATGLTVDAGLSANYFDEKAVAALVKDLYGKS